MKSVRDYLMGVVLRRAQRNDLPDRKAISIDWMAGQIGQVTVRMDMEDFVSPREALSLMAERSK